MKPTKQRLLLGLVASLMSCAVFATEYNTSALWSNTPARMMTGQQSAKLNNLTRYRLVQSENSRL